MSWRFEKQIAKIKFQARALNKYVIGPPCHSWLIPMVFDISPRVTSFAQIQRRRHGSFSRPVWQRLPWWWRWALHFYGESSEWILRENHSVLTTTHQCHGQRVDSKSSRGTDQKTTWIWTLIFALPLSQDWKNCTLLLNWLILQNCESSSWSSIRWRLSVLARLHFLIRVFQGHY